MNLRRAKRLEVSSGLVVGYVHNSLTAGLGKIGVLIALESTADEGVLAPLGKQLAMHVAAAAPQFLDVASVDPTALERERESTQGAGARFRQAGEHHRQDGRRPRPQVLRGSGAA